MMKRTLLSVAATLMLATSAHAITAGIDFNVSTGGTQPGFLGVPATANKDYNVTHNGINFDITVINANNANQNRLRGNVSLTPLTADFIQWYGTNQPGGVEANITLTGLLSGRQYELSFYHWNDGAFQSVHSIFEGTSAATGTLISNFLPSGNPSTPATWVPDFDAVLRANGAGTIEVTILAPQFVAGSNLDSRLTFNGMSVTLVPIPEPATATLGMLAVGGLMMRRRRLA
jgi:hypothetical protein